MAGMPLQTRKSVAGSTIRCGAGRRIGAALAALALLQGPISTVVLAQPATRADYEACQTRDEASFRVAIEALTIKALQKGLSGMDYKSVVAEAWRKGDVDLVINKRVDEAIDELRQETGWWKLIESLASRDAAERLATSAAERVFQRSDAVKTAIEGIAVAVGRDVGKRIELATVDAAEPATQCLQAFLGSRYGSTVAGVVGRDASQLFVIDPSKAAAQISTGQVLIEGSEGITGAVVLLVRRQLSNMAARVGQRLIGAVLGRIVSVVAGGVGMVLIAKDVWELRNGILPIIATEMKSPESHTKIQEELARAMADQMGEHVRDIGAKAADRVVDIWLDFRKAHAQVLGIADKNDNFRKFLDSVRPNNLSRLDETVTLVLANEGEAGVLKRLEDGTLREAIERLPPEAFDIARETRSLETAFAWRNLAGNALPKVVEYEVYRRNAPGEFTKPGLARVLGLGDRVAIHRLASLKASEREPLLELDDTELKRLARALPEAELAALSAYLTGLERTASQRLLAAVAQSPGKMQAIASPSVRSAILKSPDQAAAVGIMLRSDAIFEPGEFAGDVRLVRDGRVSPWLLWERYPVALSLLGVVALAFLMVMWRLIFGRRVRIAA
jgi:hypothetical protein